MEESAAEAIAKVAASITKVYKGAKYEFGDDYQEMVRPYRDEITRKMKETKQDLFVITLAMVETSTDKLTQALLLAAYVELESLKAWAPEN